MHHSSYPEKSANYSKETQSLGGLKYAQKLQATKQHREQERTRQLLVQCQMVSPGGMHKGSIAR